MNSEDLTTLAETVTQYLSIYGLRILGALAIFLVGRWIVRTGVRFAVKVMERAKLDKTLVSFSRNILYTLGLAVVLLAVLGQVGVETTSLIAVLGAAGLAVGLALQGSLSNFAAGVMIILFRPFRVGDYIEAAGVAGTVEDLNIFTTTLVTFDYKQVIVPNNSITSGNIVNYSALPRRRLDLVFGISYGDDIRKAKDILQKTGESDARVLKDPAMVIAVGELGDSSVNLYMRPWVATEDYWDVRFDLIERVKLAFDEAGITIPFPQRDVHLSGGSGLAFVQGNDGARKTGTAG